MKFLKKILEQSSWQIFGKIVTSFSTIIILGFVTRGYGQDGTGIFTLALTYLSMFYLLADFGFNAHILRSVSESAGQYIGDEWRKLLGVRIIWSALLVILAISIPLFWSFATFQFSQAIILGSLAIIASAIFTTCNLIFQKKLKYNLSVLSLSIGTVISLLLYIFLILQNIPIPFLLCVHFFGWLIIASASLIFIKKFFTNISPIFSFFYAKDLFKSSWPIAVTLALNVLYFRADSFLIAYFNSMADVGIYNVSYCVFQSALVLPTFIMNAYYPLMLKSLEKIKIIGIGLLGLSVFGTIFTLVFAPLIIQILTGGNFNGSIISLRILSLSFPAFFLSSLLMWLMIAKNKYKTMMAIYTSGLVFNIILNFIFIPKYSFLAASWITVVSEYFILIMQIVVLFLL